MSIQQLRSAVAQLPVELLPVPALGGGDKCVLDLAAALGLLEASCGGELGIRFDRGAQQVAIDDEQDCIFVTPTRTVPEVEQGEKYPQQPPPPTSTPESYPVSSPPDSYPVSSLPEKYPVASVPEKYPVVSLPETYLVSSAPAPESFPVSSLPESYPVTSLVEVETYPVTSLEEKYPVTTLQEKYPVTSLEETYPVTSLVETYPVTSLVETYPVTSLVETYPVSSPPATYPVTTITSRSTTTDCSSSIPIETPVVHEYTAVPVVPVPVPEHAEDDGFKTVVRSSSCSSSTTSQHVTSTSTSLSSASTPVTTAYQVTTPPPAVETYVANPPPPPSTCTSEYETIDVTEIEDIDEDALSEYLDLLDVNLGGIAGAPLRRRGGLSGLGDLLGLGNLLGGGSKASSNEKTTQATKKTYRMTCGVNQPPSVPSAPAPPTTISAPSHDHCLKECIRSAVDDAAQSGEVSECVAAAHNLALAEDNCQFWTGSPEAPTQEPQEQGYESDPVPTGSKDHGHGTWNVANLGGKQYIN